MDKETARIPVQVIEAHFAASEGGKESRTLPMTFYTGAKVLQFNWQNGLHNLTLSMEPTHVRLGALNSGRAPFTLGHADPNDPTATIGVIENARLENGKAKADVRFSKRPEVEPIFNDVVDGIMPNVSVGAKLHKLKEVTQEGDKLKSFLATDWEPYHVALVGVGADPKAHFAAAGADLESECEIEFAARAASPKEQAKMDNPITDAGTQARTEVNTDAVRQEAILAERTRVAEIRNIAKPFTQLNAAFVDGLVNAGKTVDESRQAILTELARVSAETVINPSNPSATVVRDEVGTRRELMEQAILNSLDGTKYSVDSQNEYRGMRISRMAETCLNKLGVKTQGKYIGEWATLAMQQTSDFPLILENSARKRLLDAYAYVMPTYKIWTKASTTPDFKTMSRYRLSETPTFLQVAEGAQITIGTMSESREQYAIATYGRGVAFTRQMLINDDLGAFNDLISAFGVQAARLENKTVYSILNTNGNMSDGNALFHASHSNLGSGALGNTALDAAFTAMATQKGLDGVTVLNLAPKFLITPVAKAATAQSVLTPVGPSVKISDQNWFAGRLTPVADAELDGTSTSVYYLAADPMVAPGIEYCYLEGSNGPQILRKDNEGGVLGIQLYAYLDFGAKAIDWRSMYKSTGV